MLTFMPLPINAAAALRLEIAMIVSSTAVRASSKAQPLVPVRAGADVPRKMTSVGRSLPNKSRAARSTLVLLWKDLT